MENMDIGDLMMKGGGVGDDLPDEMFEDMLHAAIRSNRKFQKTMREALKATQQVMLEDRIKQLKEQFNRHTYTGAAGGPTAPPCPAIFSGNPFDLDWDEDEKITQPMGMNAQAIADQEKVRAERKAQGICPECGDVKREISVGICRDHGKFLG